jgi:hypothetical protein
VTAVEEHEDFIDFIGRSGSVYRCMRMYERLSGYGASVLENILEELNQSGQAKAGLITFEDFRGMHRG